jgi:hypothetical protein
MMNLRGSLVIAAGLMVLSSGSMARAEESATIAQKTAPAPAEPRHSLNLGIGTMWGAPSLSYEYLWHSSGLILEVSGLYDREEDGTEMAAGWAIGYRWHWSKRQDSGFLGIHTGYDYVSSPRTAEMMEAPLYDERTFYVVGNIGKRWNMGNRVNITARLGAGYASREMASDGFIDEVVSSIPFTVDGELSAGLMF